MRAANLLASWRGLRNPASIAILWRVQGFLMQSGHSDAAAALGLIRIDFGVNRLSSDVEFARNSRIQPAHRRCAAAGLSAGPHDVRRVISCKGGRGTKFRIARAYRPGPERRADIRRRCRHRQANMLDTENVVAFYLVPTVRSARTLSRKPATVPRHHHLVDDGYPATWGTSPLTERQHRQHHAARYRGRQRLVRTPPTTCSRWRRRTEDIAGSDARKLQRRFRNPTHRRKRR